MASYISAVSGLSIRSPWRSRGRPWALVLRAFLAVSVVMAMVARAQPQSPQPGEPVLAQPAAEDACKALATADFSTITDAPAQITHTEVVAASDPYPAYCKVSGYVVPQVGFEVRLPSSGWNGKFIELGCGGWCGAIRGGACAAPLRKGYACAVTDGGHRGREDQGLWASGNLQAQIDFGYRAVHVTALAAKAIIARFYSNTPRYSYFNGCSTGGYQGLVAAQRFPWDFNGIIAGAPDLDHADTQMRAIWHWRAFFRPDGTARLGSADLQLLHAAALARCDQDDGVRDGIIGNPSQCKFDPAVLACKSGQTRACLSAEQVEAARKVYQGPTNSRGEAISTRGFFPGSELGWARWKAADVHYAEEFFRYALFHPAPGTHWSASDFDFDRDYQRLGAGAVYTNTNPDLRKFKAAGGKLIAYQGGTDATEIPGALYDYYETVERTVGGPAATREFFRLYTVPGMNHCGGGEGIDTVDFLSALEQWVETRQAPEAIIGAHIDTDSLMKSQRGGESYWVELDRISTDPAYVQFTRPLYPYPAFARYKGTGDPRRAENFRGR